MLYEVITKISKSLHTEKAEIQWTLTKNGEPSSYVGELSKTGGTIEIHDIGDFVLTAVVTDSLGRECSYSQNISVVNTAPTIDRFTVNPTRTAKDGSFFVNISATATDAENHKTTLEWQGKTENGYYSSYNFV